MGKNLNLKVKEDLPDYFLSNNSTTQSSKPSALCCVTLACPSLNREADFEHLFNLEASQGLRSSNREVVGLLSQRGAPSLPRPSLVKPTKVISAPKASPASKIHSQAHQADKISSYENGLRTLINSEIWTLEEQISDTPMSLENTSNNTFSEQVASYATLDPGGEQMILPDLPDDLANRQITKKVPAPSVGKSLLLKPAPSSKKKLMVKGGNTISIPENAVAEVPFDASQMDPTLDLFPDLFNILGQDQAIELDVPVVIPPPASDSNVKDEWNLEKDLAPIAESKPVLNTNAMLSVNPMEAEGVSVSPPQADEDLDKPVTASDFDLLEFAMESSGLASGENDAHSYDPTNIIDLMLNDDITENDQAFLDLVKTDDDSNINNAAAAGGSTLNLDDIQPSTSKRPWMPSAAVVKPEPFDEEDPDFAPTPAKRPRGRPRLPRPETEPPRYSSVNDFTNCSQNSLTTNSNNCDFRRPRGRPPTARPFADVSAYEDTSGMSSEEAKDLKYRRMRDLNNAASKRCRLNRKMKFDKMEIEEQQLLAKNTQLKAQVEGLENQVNRLKELVLGMVSKVKNEETEQNTATDEAIENFDIDQLVNDTIEDMQE